MSTKNGMDTTILNSDYPIKMTSPDGYISGGRVMRQSPFSHPRRACPILQCYQKLWLTRAALPLLGLKAELSNKILVCVGIWITGHQKFVAVKNRIGTGDETQGFDRFTKFFAAS